MVKSALRMPQGTELLNHVREAEFRGKARLLPLQLKLQRQEATAHLPHDEYLNRTHSHRYQGQNPKLWQHEIYSKFVARQTL